MDSIQWAGVWFGAAGGSGLSVGVGGSTGVRVGRRSGMGGIGVRIGIGAIRGLGLNRNSSQRDSAVCLRRCIAPEVGRT